jgi:GTP-binding protein HflX
LKDQLRRTREIRGSETAVLVAVRLAGKSVGEVEDSLSELERLANSAGAQVVGQVVQERKSPDPRFFVGEGKALDLKRSYQDRADMIIFDSDLSGSQQRNLEDLSEMKIVDRSGLILDIFAQRAQTREGKAQVELAQLEYLLSRLVGGHPFLSRLGGGIGTRGPGETKLESDRRRIRRRMDHIRISLEGVRRTREIMRRNRRRRHFPIISLVGYTNAGKSTLFNTLTRAHAEVKDRLFATLDPTVRRICLPGGKQALLFDTVGFIRNLPHQLIHAFRATLEELLSADLLLHVVDASHPDRDGQIMAVKEVLGEIGAASKPALLVYNKIDRLDVHEGSCFWRTEKERICISALTGKGIEDLRAHIHSYLPSDFSPEGS